MVAEDPDGDTKRTELEERRCHLRRHGNFCRDDLEENRVRRLTVQD